MSVLHTKVYDSAKKISYLVDIKNKFTIIADNSGTGKSSLLDLIRSEEHLSHVSVTGDCVLIELPSRMRNYPKILYTLRSLAESQAPQNITPERIVFYCDENHQMINDLAYQEQVIKSDYSFLIISRLPLKRIPYGVNDLYRIKSYGPDGRSHSMVPVYQERSPAFLKYRLLKTEDLKSSFLFFSKFLKSVESCGGKWNVYRLCSHDANTLYFVDGLGFGSEYVRVSEAINFFGHRNGLWVVESFEFLLLSSGMFTNHILPIVNRYLSFIGKDPLSTIPEIADDFCANKEEYYNSQLVNIMSALSQHYSKEDPGKCFLENCCDFINWHTHKYEDACPLYFEGNKFELILGKDLYEILCKAFGRKASELGEVKGLENSGAGETTSAFDRFSE